MGVGWVLEEVLGAERKERKIGYHASFEPFGMNTEVAAGDGSSQSMLCGDAYLRM
jgi:hypothetical protein